MNWILAQKQGFSGLTVKIRYFVTNSESVVPKNDTMSFLTIKMVVLGRRGGGKSVTMTDLTVKDTPDKSHFHFLLKCVSGLDY